MDEIYVKVGGTNMELLLANVWLKNLSGHTLMTLPLTITLQGDSWANQLRVLRAAGPALIQPDETQIQGGLTISCSTH